MVEILPTKVGSNLGIPSLVDVLNVSHKTITNWIEVLKGVYLVFTIAPWHRNIKRSIVKEKSCISSNGHCFSIADHDLRTFLPSAFSGWQQGSQRSG